MVCKWPLPLPFEAIWCREEEQDGESPCKILCVALPLAMPTDQSIYFVSQTTLQLAHKIRPKQSCVNSKSEPIFP